MRPRSSKLMCVGCATSGSLAMSSTARSSAVVIFASDSAGESRAPGINSGLTESGVVAGR
jgi:hypothetical protein